MRMHRIIPVAVAGIAILGSGCAKTSPPPGADSTMQRDSTSNVSQNPVNNPVGKLDDNNAKTATTDTAAGLGRRNDSIVRHGSPLSSKTATRP